MTAQGSPWTALLFVAAALIFLALTLAMSYEAWAIATGHTTISAITAQAIQNSPWKAIFGVALFFFLAGLLLAHFTSWDA